MIKLLYDNGYRLDHYISNPNIERTINGPYFLEFELPIDLEIANLIEENMEIEASIPNNETDLFRVRLIRKDLDVIYFYCTQVFFSLEDNFIEDTNIVSKSGLGAMVQISNATQYSHNFNFFSDIGTVKNARMVRKNVVSAILGSEDNSFVKRWGGELDIHNYDVKMLTKLGADRGVTIEYKKNLTGLDGTIDYSTYYTRCMPQGFDGLFLEEKYVDSPNINTEHPIIKVVEFPDIKVRESEDDEGYATKEEAQNALREAVNNLYEQGADSPQGSYEINFVELTKTEEYKNYSILERLWIGDTVTVRHDTFNVKARCMHYSYNPISCMYNSITLGDVINGIIENNDSIQDEIDKVVDGTKDDYAKYLEKAIEEATALINNGLGGHAYKTRNEFLILDTEDIMTAVKVLRINQNGIGFSATGYAGPYTTAMTADGKLVISEATANKFTAALIKTGMLMSANGTTWIDMESGSFNFGDTLKFDGTTTTYSGKLRAEVPNQPSKFAELTPTLTDDGQHISYRMTLGSSLSDFKILWNGGSEMAYFGAGGFQTDNYVTFRTNQTGPYNTNCYWENGTYRPAVANKALLGTNTYYFNNVFSRFFGLDRGSETYTTLQAGTVNIRTMHNSEANDSGIMFTYNGYVQPASNLAWSIGGSNNRFSTGYFNAVDAPSDLQLKENVRYLLKDENQAVTFSTQLADITTEDLYNFIKDDIKIAEFNYKLPDEKKEEIFDSIGFIAQDIQGTKIGDKLLKNKGEFLSYDLANYISVTAGALQKAVEKIEDLQKRIELLESGVN